jgi:hypothetical protein
LKLRFKVIKMALFSHFLLKKCFWLKMVEENRLCMISS